MASLPPDLTVQVSKHIGTLQADTHAGILCQLRMMFSSLQHQVTAELWISAHWSTCQKVISWQKSKVVVKLMFDLLVSKCHDVTHPPSSS